VLLLSAGVEQSNLLAQQRSASGFGQPTRPRPTNASIQSRRDHVHAMGTTFTVRSTPGQLDLNEWRFTHTYRRASDLSAAPPCERSPP